MEKWFKVYNTLDEFKTQKLSINQSNTEYITYENPVQTYGVPDVNWNQIAFVLDTCVIYIKGKILYDLESLLNIIEDNEDIQAAALNQMHSDINQLIEDFNDLLEDYTNEHNDFIEQWENKESVIAESLNDLHNRVSALEETTT